MNPEQETVTLEYKGVTTGRLFASHLFDFFTVAVLAILLLVGALFALNAMPFYRDIVSRRDEIQLSSKLYVKTESDSPELLANSLNENTELTTKEKNDQLSTALVFFFDDYLAENSTVTNGSALYTNYLQKFTLSTGEKMFDNSRNRLFSESVYDENYFSAYFEVSNAYAIGYLSYVKDYTEIRREYIWSFAVTVLISLSLAVILLLFVVPLIFSKGKRTFGMVLNKVAYVQANGFSVSFPRFLLFFLFRWIFIYLASVVTFLIPVFISVTMMFCSKAHQTLSDYLFGCYSVYVEQDIVFKNYEEYQEIQNLRAEKEKDLFSDHLVH